jgi:hypothetical protein
LGDWEIERFWVIGASEFLTAKNAKKRKDEKRDPENRVQISEIDRGLGGLSGSDGFS